MEDLLQQIEKACDAGLYYVALMMAMALPDMCAALEASDGVTSGERYRAWYDKNMLGGYLERPYGSGPGEPVWLSSDDCWKFRCSLLHQGRGEHARSETKRLMFLEPGKGGPVHKMRVDHAQNGVLLDLPTFVADMIRSVRQWHQGVRGTEPYKTNVKAFIRRHHHWRHAFVSDRPVIA